MEYNNRLKELREDRDLTLAEIDINNFFKYCRL